jgi:hypothetical protein
MKSLQPHIDGFGALGVKREDGETRSITPPTSDGASTSHRSRERTPGSCSGEEWTVSYESIPMIRNL